MDARRNLGRMGRMKEIGVRVLGIVTSCSCSIALCNSPAVIALDPGGIICEERLLGGEELTPERRIDQRRFGILVGEVVDPSAIILS